MMEKFSALVKLGIKYLYRYRRRYGFLFAALVFGFAVVTFITSIKDGMYDNVYYTAQSHYSGDVVALAESSYASGSHMNESEIAAILNAAEAAGLEPEYTVKRTSYFARGIVHYNGAAVPLRYTVGCDWESEDFFFTRLSYDEPPDSSIGDDGILLSAPIAGFLGARKGDNVILELNTAQGQRNTGVFLVKGIVRDASIFGYYKAYISRLSLNRLLGNADDDCSTIGFFFGDTGATERKRRDLYDALAGQLQIAPLFYDREEFRDRFDPPWEWEGKVFFLQSLPVYLTEIADLLNAINLVSYFLYGMMLLIILVSATVTYRLILHERVKEMGTMRAIGFYGQDLRLVLWTEVAILAVISLLAGFLLAWLLSWAVSFLSFSWFPGFEMFLRDGKLTALYKPETMLLNAVSIFLVLFLTALFPSFRASQKNLPGLLSGEPL